MKMLGIIGGMGPNSTAEFYLKLNQLALQHGLASRPYCTIINLPLNLKIEESVLLGEASIDQYLPLLEEALQKLEITGCDYIAIPCNTVHVLMDTLVGYTKIPIVNIIDETVSKLCKEQVSEVLILGTTQTINSNLYQDKLRKAEIDFKIPSEPGQTELNQIIDELVNFKADAGLGDKFNGIVESSGSSNVILGCTDLHAVKDTDEMVRYFDSMEILAEACVELITKDNEN